MVFEIHYTINGTDDFFVITGDSIKEIRQKAKEETDRRNLDQQKNNLWSRQLE